MCNDQLSVSERTAEIGAGVGDDARSASKFDDMVVVRAASYTCSVNPRRLHERRRNPGRHEGSSSSSSAVTVYSRTLQRLGGALVVSACLLSALRLPQAMAAPMGSGSLQELLNSREEWLNPCGNTDTDSGGDSYFQDLSATTETDGDADLLYKISIPVGNALLHIQSFSDKFAYAVLGTSVKLAPYSGDSRYDWLPSRTDIPKEVGKDLPEGYLESLELEMVLRNTYEYLQRFAVGLEQIDWDQKQRGGPFVDEFTHVMAYIRQILCEIHTMMQYKSIPLPKAVHRDIMNMELRTVEAATERNVRDWLIFRDYMNALEYLNVVYNHLKMKAS